MGAAEYTVFGAGSIGTVLAGCLADAGVAVAIAGRGAVPDLRLEGNDETVIARVPVVREPEGTILLCVHAPDVAELCARWPGRTVVTFQNGVASEAVAAETCRVLGAVWRMTCELTAPGLARFTRRGRIIVGPWSAGTDAAPLAADLRRAGFDAACSGDIGADKWLKLFVNLASVPNALVRPADHELPAFSAIKAALLEEARDVFAAAGVTARSCDGRDASLDEEIERQRSGGVRGRTVHNGIWRRLAHGRPPGDRHGATLMELARQAGVQAPRNAAMLALLDAAEGPECYGAQEVLNRLSGTARDIGYTS